MFIIFIRIQIVLIVAATLAYGQPVETVIQKGHELSVRCVAISPDSSLIATAHKPPIGDCFATARNDGRVFAKGMDTHRDAHVYVI